MAATPKPVRKKQKEKMLKDKKNLSDSVKHIQKLMQILEKKVALQ